jgi:hypothetical protein
MAARGEKQRAQSGVGLYLRAGHGGGVKLESCCGPKAGFAAWAGTRKAQAEAAQRAGTSYVGRCISRMKVNRGRNGAVQKPS